MKKIIFCFVSVLGFLTGTILYGSVYPPYDITNEPGFVSQSDVCYFPPEAKEQCHASTIVQMPNGHLLCAWFHGSNEGNPDVCIYISEGTSPVKTDGIWTWSKARLIAKGYTAFGKGAPCYNPVLFLSNKPDPNGKKPIILFYKVGPGTALWTSLMIKSYDNGKTWTKAVTFPSNLDGPVKNKPVQLADGTILCGTSSEVAGQRDYFSWSKDNGRTWDYCGPFNLGPFGFLFHTIQPTILIHPDGTLQALCRTNVGYICQMKSNVNSYWKWSNPETMKNLPNNDSGIDAVTVKLKNGKTEYLLAYNDTSDSGWRDRLKIAASFDGKHWWNVFILRGHTGGEFSYPAIIQTKDGMVHVTYSFYKKLIHHVVIDPNKLCAIDMI